MHRVVAAAVAVAVVVVVAVEAVVAALPAHRRANSFGVLRGGIGEFRGRAPSSLFSSAVSATGLPSGEQQLVCIGSAVPVPDWMLYQQNPDALPTECADGTGPGQLVSSTRSNVTVIDPEFVAPRAWRGSRGFVKRRGLRYSISVDGSYALGTNLYGVTDLNLNTTPQFTLDDEGGRPIYVPASSIIPTTGATSVLGSRLYDQYAHVYDVNSALSSRTTQVTSTFNAVSFTNLIWSVSYTYQHARDQSSSSGGSPGGGFGAPTTGANPNVIDWARSSLGRTHNIQGSTTWQARSWIDLTSVLSFSSGAPYTPVVGSDINGDGARNDRAYVFNPLTAPDTALQNGMQRLLAGAPAKARNCLLAQMNSIAARNSCEGDWAPRLDLQANLRPDFGGSIGQKLQLQVQLVNPLTGLDQLLHGSNLRGWGQTSRVDPNLLFVRGFDPSTSRYIYQVNERFGNNPATRSAVFAPFQVSLTGRLQVGPDMVRDRQQAMLRAITRNPALARGDVQPIVDRVAPNPAVTLAGLVDSLHIVLTPAQKDSVQAIGALMEHKDSVLVEELRTKLDSAGGDIRAAFPQIQPVLQLARNNYVAAVKSMQAVLTPEQWALLPEWFRNPTTQPQAGGRPGQGGARGGRPPE